MKNYYTTEQGFHSVESLFNKIGKVLVVLLALSFAAMIIYALYIILPTWLFVISCIAIVILSWLAYEVKHAKVKEPDPYVERQRFISQKKER